MNDRLKILLLLVIGALFQTGCGTEAAYNEESFSSDSPFKLRVDGDIEAACESARRSLLGQGYLIDLASSEEVKGRKAARVEGQQNAFIEMTVVCVPERGGSTVFATGVLSTYDLKKNSSSASVGLSALGSISLPIGQSVDSLVKVSEQTIDDKEFYKRFFSAVETILGEMRIREADDDPATEPAQESTAQEAGQPVAQPRIWPELFPEQSASAQEICAGRIRAGRIRAGRICGYAPAFRRAGSARSRASGGSCPGGAGNRARGGSCPGGASNRSRSVPCAGGRSGACPAGSACSDSANARARGACARARSGGSAISNSTDTHCE
ncbi:MAG: DUF2242 domain-containing protein [Haliea sp.]|nr:DUF2242 domain-containing protein [Haliea sp.]